MLIYILHNDYLTTFHLPKEGSGSIFIQDYDYNSNLKNLITADFENGKWYIHPDNYVKVIFNNQYVDKVELMLNKFYLLRTNNNEPIILYPALAYDNNYVIKEIDNEDTITFGKSNSSDVILSPADSLADKQFTLTYKAGKWICNNLNPKVPLYCNGEKVKDNKYLDSTDTLFIMGFKIIVFGKMVYINTTNKNINFTSNKLRDKVPSNFVVPKVETGDQVFNDFYSPAEYFSKSPVFVRKIDPIKLDVVNPNPREKAGSEGFIMNFIPTILMSSTSLLSAFFAIKGYNAKDPNSTENLITTVIMCGIMIVVSILWPLLQEFADRIGRHLRNASNEIRYRKYMGDIEDALKQASSDQKTALVFNNLALKKCEEAIINRDANLYSINSDQNRFLNIRLGIGKVKLDSEINFNMSTGYETKDKLQKLAENTIKKYEYIDEAPYTFSFKNSIAFINSEGNFRQYYEAIILQLITFHDYNNLKIVVFTSKDSKLNAIRNLNHCWSEDKSTRYFATNTQEAEILSGQLIRILNSRKESKSNDTESNNFTPHYLIITDDVYKYRNTTIINKVNELKDYYGFSTVTFAHRINEVPNGCKYFLEYDDKKCILFESEMSNDTTTEFTPEFIPDDIDFSRVINLINNIPISGNVDQSGNGVLPEKFGFLEMCNVGNVNQLNSVSRWKNSSIINSLATPIGIDTSGNLLKLDLHEKAHGPHGLIAGMTGSGKSETIVSYILSLAVNYSPNEVQFVLIDYKGGGLAGAFENRKTGIKLPHLVGTITNLDKSSMNRTLVSIKSELQRRQRVFNETKEELDIATIDIYKYQELYRSGSIKEPMSHLFIICDEFAELKAQQPDFMDELVSAARIGRSLGIHLILATQKPSGVVDEQIWSNSKFKICAKVQTSEDSMEMINKPDAAYIKESGRFYLQVGYDEIFIKAQSAYTGVKYVPHNSAFVANSGNTITFVDNLGNSIKTVKKEEQKTNVSEDLGDELGNVTKYLIECSKQIGFENKQLWLDNVSEELYFYPLMKKYNHVERRGIINPLIGEYDDPGNQKQGPVSINISEKGNLWICGMTGSGKTTLLSTLIFSTIIHHSSKEVNIFIMDLVSESMRVFADAPQVADIVTSSEHDKINKIVYFLKNEIERRKKILSQSVQPFQVLAQKGENPFPELLICINGYDVLYDSYFELLDDVLTPVIRDSRRVGISFVMTSTGQISAKLEGSFSQRLALRFVEAEEYLNLFDNTNNIIPQAVPGRGLIELGNIFEFQAARIFKDDEFDAKFSYIIKQLNDMYPKAEGIPSMPKVASYENVKNEIITLDSVPIGFELISNCVKFFNFDNLINLVLYGEPSHGQGFSTALIKVLKTIPNTRIVWIDALNNENEVEGIKRYDNSYGNLSVSLHKNIVEKKSNDPNSEKIIFIISGYSAIQKYLVKAKEEENPEAKTIDELIVAAIGADNYKFILLDSANIRSIDDCKWIDYYDYDRGILLARDPEEQEIFDIDESIMGGSDIIKYNRDIATVISQGVPTIIKYIRK